MMIIEVERLGEYHFPFESEMLIEVQCILFHDEASEILEPLNDQFADIRDHCQFILIVGVDEIHGLFRYSLDPGLIQYPDTVIVSDPHDDVLLHFIGRIHECLQASGDVVDAEIL